MSWKGIKHNQVGEQLDSTEFHSEELHELQNGTELPETANGGDLFLKTDEGRVYIYKPD